MKSRALLINVKSDLFYFCAEMSYGSVQLYGKNNVKNC